MKVVVDASECRRRKSGVVVGPLEVRFGEVAFPAKRWRDFPVVVLAWICAALLEVRGGGSSSVSFMDGPFELEFVTIEEGLRVSGFRRGVDARVTEFVGVVSQSEAERAVLEAGTALLDEIEGPHSRDDLALRSAIDGLMS